MKFWFDMQNFSNLAKMVCEKNVPEYAELFMHWAVIVGDYFAQTTQPCKIISMHGKKGLMIRVQSGYGIIMQHKTPELLHKINAHIKRSKLLYIKVVQ